MALTAEQQSSVDVAIAIESDRHTKQLEQQAKQTKLEAIRIAQQTLIENRRNQPVDQREITAAEITAFAVTLVNYVNG